MDIIQVGINSLTRASESSPWKITFSNPSDGTKMTASIGDGGMETGPRLREVLTSIERNGHLYPRMIKGKELELLGMTTRDSFEIKLLANKPAYVEIGFRPFRQFTKPVAPPINHTYGDDWEEEDDWQIQAAPQFRIMAEEVISGGDGFTPNFVTDVSQTGYLVSGELVKVKDGDTFDLKIKEVGSLAATDKRLAEGKTITIRMLGINTPETRSHGVQEGNERNKDYMKAYGFTEEEAFQVGEEAMDTLEDFFNGSGTLVVDLDSTASGSVKMDAYDRYIGAVYMVDREEEEIFSSGFQADNLSKLMMGTRQSVVEGKEGPLAIPYYNFIDNDYSRLNPVEWLYDVGIRNRSKEKIGDRLKKEKEKLTKDNPKPLEDGQVVEVRPVDRRSNQLEFIEPVDDRIEDLFPGGIDHRMRIGDVMLTIPPLSIEVNRTTNIQKIKTLRSKSSMITKGGSAVTTITLQLYFHDLDSINGRQVKVHDDLPNRHYYMDGLRPLIAQFKKAPFVPIDNKYLNDTLGIDSVALVNLSVQTVPGFPHSIAANLTLAKFEHEAYMPQVSRLSMAMNYPLFRWYYQEPMRDDIPEEKLSDYRTWLKSIPGSGLTNDFEFQMVNEDTLLVRKEAINGLRYLVNPIIMKERFENVRSDRLGDAGDGTDTFTLLGKKFKDGQAAQRVLDMRDRFHKLRQEGKIPTETVQDAEMTRELPVIAKDYRSIHTRPAKQLSQKAVSAYKAIYGDDDELTVLNKSHYAPLESVLFEANDKSLTIPNDEPGGGFKIRLYSMDNMNLIKDEYKRDTKNELTSYFVPWGDYHILHQIVERGKAAEDSYLAAIQNYNDKMALVHATEGKLDLTTFDIGGHFLPIDMSIMYENQFSSAQLQMLDSPTFQFLGGQDPYIQVTFEADEQAVEDVRFMMEETERYSREYRTGITSGFLGVKNHLMQLFGIETIMPESVQIRTVSGFPGRYEISMNLVGFNKTQKRMETLEGISPVYDVSDRETRRTGNYDPSMDDSIIYYKMHNMELYPDLELPTYDELINMLPYTKSGVSVYLNRTGAKFVDPDFYMATPVTAREIIYEQSQMPQEMKVTDLTGLSVYTGSQSGGPIQADANTLEMLAELNKRTDRINADFNWKGTADGKTSVHTNDGEVTYANKDVETYVKDRDTLNAIPSYEEWVDIGMGKDPRAYSSWKENGINPSEWEVYNKIYELVDTYWTGTYAKDDRKENLAKVGPWRNVTYVSIEDMKDLTWNHLVKENKELLRKGQSAKHKIDGDVSEADFKKMGYKPTRERIANYIKALLHYVSGWAQVKENMTPRIDTGKNGVGIGCVPISSEATTLKIAKRLIWDWEYNLEWAVGQLFEAYRAAHEESNLKYKSCPWDWMISAYATGSIKTEKNSVFYQRVINMFVSHYNGYPRLYATPSSYMNNDILQQRNGFSSRQMGLLNGQKDALIDELLDADYRTKKDKERTSKDVTRKALEKKSAAELVSLYEEHMEYLGNKSQGRTLSTYQSGSGSTVGARQITPTTEMYEGSNERYRGANQVEWENYSAYKAAKDYLKKSSAANLASHVTPEKAFTSMMTDMIHYDQRMRLLRAFPTFQMFIVDEGRWMTNYRLWDNLYGFNAIQSIDIHKSRKVVADTAVITMTNIYSNLTSRTLDTSYEERDYKFWDNLVFGNPNESLLEARKDLQNSLLLQTGARIHLRLGYGSSANDLPVVFNGTITELDTQDLVTIVCQSDGLELTNVISADEGDTNSNFLRVQEPRDTICHLLTSKGNWFKDAINYASDGKFFKSNPLGIQHFGQPGEVVPEGTWKFFNSEYGEAAQNIYSSNGVGTFSQWLMIDEDTGEEKAMPVTWDTPVMKWLQPGDEDNIKVSFYGNTVWDIAATMASCSPDYIAAVHPFEMRSTLFFGKPWWGLAYTYDSRYEYDKSQEAWVRYRNLEHRKSYSQFHIFDSTMDIISNKIKASEDGVYTAVIAQAEGQVSHTMYADWDIRYDKQKTTMIDTELVGRMPGLNFFTTEKQLDLHAASAVRDYMKDMYKGQLLILGDPTLKPHDLCYMNDEMMEMNGNFLVKSVTHSFSHETGFISTVEPDALVVNDDIAMISMSNWAYSLGANTVAATLGYKFGAKAIRRMIPNAVAEKAIQLGGEAGQKATPKAIKMLLRFLPKDDADVEAFKGLINDLDEMDLDDVNRPGQIEKIQNKAKDIEGKMKDFMTRVEDSGEVVKKRSIDRWALRRNVGVIKSASESLTKGAKAYKVLRVASGTVMGINPISFALGATATWVTETLLEKYTRKKASMQCCLMMPMTYKGREYAAGINQHKGLVLGDSMGRMDSLMSGMGFDGENGNNASEWVFDALNWMSGSQKDYSITQDDIMDGSWKK